MTIHPDAYSTITRCEVEVASALLTFMTIFLDSGVPVERLRKDLKEFAAKNEVWDALERIERARDAEIAAFEAGEDPPDEDAEVDDPEDGRLTS